MIKYKYILLVFFIIVSLIHSEYVVKNVITAPTDYCYNGSGCEFTYVVVFTDNEGLGLSGCLNCGLLFYIYSKVGNEYLVRLTATVGFGMANTTLMITDDTTNSHDTVFPTPVCMEIPYPVTLLQPVSFQKYIFANSLDLIDTYERFRIMSLGFKLNVTKGVKWTVTCQGVKCLDPSYSSMNSDMQFITITWESPVMDPAAPVALTQPESFTVTFTDSLTRSTVFTVNNPIANADTSNVEVSIHPSPTSTFVKIPNSLNYFVTVPRNFSSNMIAYNAMTSALEVSVPRGTLVYQDNFTATMLYSNKIELQDTWRSSINFYSNYTLEYKDTNATFLGSLSSPLLSPLYTLQSTLQNIVDQPTYRIVTVGITAMTYASGNTSILMNMGGSMFFRLTPPYPIGIMDGNYGSAIGQYSLVISAFCRSNMGFYYGSANPASYDVISTTPDNVIPDITKVEWVSLKGLTMVIRITASDSDSGVAYIQIGQSSKSDGYKLFPSDLISGTFKSGVFEKVITLEAKEIIDLERILIFDQAGNQAMIDYEFKSGNLYPPFKIFPYAIPLSDFQPSDTFINYFEFLHNDIDCTDTDFVNTLVLNFSTPNNQYRKVFIKLDHDKDYTAGEWDDVYKAFVINFKIPMNPPPGPLFYNLRYPSITLSSFDLVQMIGSKAELRVVSQRGGDRMPPAITSVTPIQFATFLTWTIVIEDLINGFKSGIIQIQSTNDLQPYEFLLNSVGKNQSLDTYVLSIPIPSVCRVAESYQIVYVELEDNGGAKGIYSRGLVIDNGISPLLYLENEITVLNVPCTTPSSDITPPYVVGNSVLGIPLDVFSNTRLVNISFQIKDADSNISGRHIPWCRYYTLYQEFYIKSNSYTQVLANHYIADCSTNLPYGFGFPIGEFYISIHGYADDVYNVGGNEWSVPFQVTSMFNVPIIESYLPVYTDEDQLVLFGRNFGEILTDIAIHISSNSTVNYTANAFSTVMVNIISIPKSNVPYDVIVYVAGVASNTLTVVPKVRQVIVFPTPTPSFTQVPQKCAGTPECSGKGTCTPTGCICSEPWFGIDCSSRVIPSQPPIVNSSSPQATTQVDIIPGSSDSQEEDIISLTTLISIVSLDEYKFDGTLVNSHKFDEDWVFTNSTLEGSQNLRYLYETQVTRYSTTTNITVAMEWFRDSQIIRFADQDLVMNPSTLKYNITMTKYHFESNLNRLQLRMYASIISSESTVGSCIYQDSGNTTDSDSEYIKLQVNGNSLYGRFIKRAIVDTRITAISTIVTSDTENESTNQISSYLAIQIPFYSTKVHIDPDFSILVDTKPAREQPNSLCTDSLDSDSLTTVQLIGIIVGCSLAVILVGVALFIYQYRKHWTWGVKIRRVFRLQRISRKI
ncbi:EGF-like domain-containing protein [Tieghemostelium lacteum]|uniref:EGF-like domain-containing protein n=1 Tax=Tieghemostelium lacteum TaxID=361077 RepID=A0A151ZIT7_TIELA|nr:EGF-like domain-containing protein [Tieghemostelium lacteum]|eukprot:KYQ93866.1 EGF-like domain-containing protein [Tieghemostelium lacteum]